MSFELAEDVRAELERLARITKRDPNDILRELLEMPPIPKRKPDGLSAAGGMTTPLPPQFFDTPKGDRPPWGKIVMKPKKKGSHAEA